MGTLSEDLETLRELNEFRERAKELLHLGLQPLKTIINVVSDEKPNKRIVGKKPKKDSDPDFGFEHWASSSNNIETALLAKLQNHRDICQTEGENNLANAEIKLTNLLTHINLKTDLMPLEEEEPPNIDEMKSVPVIAAARTMQILVIRSQTTLSRASMICYYRILRELYGAAPPDWTVGAARAGIHGTTSAFVTGECVRALFTFRNTIERTSNFCRETVKLIDSYDNLRVMLDYLGDEISLNHPLRRWADKTMEAFWLDWFVSTNLRVGEIALYYHEKEKKTGTKFDSKISNKVSGNHPNKLFTCAAQNRKTSKKIIIEKVGEYFKTLCDYLEKSLNEAIFQINAAEVEIKDYRKSENDLLKKVISADGDKNKIKELNERMQRSESAHLFAELRITDSKRQIERVLENIKVNKQKAKTEKKGKSKPAELELIDHKYLKNILNSLATVCDHNASHLNQMAAPTKQYIKSVLRRELYNSPNRFDAGELVFAAMSFGAMTEWKQHELLQKACKKLVKALPENGRLPTSRPLHTSTRGYRLLPIGCEMTRGLAHLFDSMNFEFSAKFVGRIMNVFEEKFQIIRDKNSNNTFIGWNFDGAPNPNAPCVWVTAVSVLALDRVVRMLNTRINNTIIKHFEVIKPEKPHTGLPINDLIFADYGFNEYFFNKYPKEYEKMPPIPIQLELMRAHLMRACLPYNYSLNKNRKVYSTILYGPPGTGKTTLAEVVAFNSGKPLIKLSPSDLNLQGEGLIEGRAHDIFEALSMLTQTVIIFDEFEPVLKERKRIRISSENRRTDKEELPEVNIQTTNNEGSPLVYRDWQLRGISNTLFKGIGDNKKFFNEMYSTMEKVSGALRDISEKDDPKFRFLLGGMLPKLLKLHDSAKAQSLVYFLGTNVLKDIDSAAQRSGRFDLKVPIYNPCPLSRAGTLLYRLSSLKKLEQINLSENKEQVRRFLEVVVATVNEPASELSKKYYHSKSTNLDYIYNGTGKSSPPQEKKLEEMTREFERDRNTQKEIEQAECEWLAGFEKHVEKKFRDIDLINHSDKLLEYLADVFTYKPKNTKSLK